MTATQQKWVDTDIVFLLQITWGSRTYRFSTYPVTVGNHFYSGGLDDPDINLQMADGYNIDGDSLPLRLVFPVDVSTTINRGIYLDGSPGELSYVFLKNGQVLQTYEQRYIVFSGIASEPVFGQATQPTGYVEFSLEERVYMQEADLLTAVVGTAGKLNEVNISNAEKASGSPLAGISTAGIVQVEDVHEGKNFPFVFGRTGLGFSATSMTPYEHIVSPAYLIGLDTGTVGIPMYFLVAGHLVDATNLKIYDSEGNSDTGGVTSWVNSNNDIFSVCAINFATPTLANAINNNEIEYYCVWDLKGGYPSPYSEGSLENGLEIVLFCLEQVTKDIDYNAFFSLFPILEQYKFAGYVNKPINPVEFITNYILEYLPINIQVGPNGIAPVIDICKNSGLVTPVQTITTDETFYRISPIETSSDYKDIVNQIDIQYGKNSIKDKYNGVVQVIPDKVTAAWFKYTNDMAFISNLQFGTRSKTITADYIYDYNTAVQVATDYIQKYSLPTREVTFIAHPKWGYLRVGDIIGLTDTELGITDQKAQIIGKKWAGASWEYRFSLPNETKYNV